MDNVSKSLSLIGNLLGGFIAIAVGASVLSSVSNSIRRRGLPLYSRATYSYTDDSPQTKRSSEFADVGSKAKDKTADAYNKTKEDYFNRSKFD